MASSLATHPANEAHLNLNLRTDISGGGGGRAQRGGTEMGETGRKRERDERKGEKKDDEENATRVKR